MKPTLAISFVYFFPLFTLLLNSCGTPTVNHSVFAKPDPKNYTNLVVCTSEDVAYEQERCVLNPLLMAETKLNVKIGKTQEYVGKAFLKHSGIMITHAGYSVAGFDRLKFVIALRKALKVDKKSSKKDINLLVDQKIEPISSKPTSRKFVLFLRNTKTGSHVYLKIGGEIDSTSKDEFSKAIRLMSNVEKLHGKLLVQSDSFSTYL